MSRTLRRQNGKRNWRNPDNHECAWYKHRGSWNVKYIPLTWEEQDRMVRENIISHEKKESNSWRTSANSSVKWHSNRLVRQSTRAELHKVMKDPSYDFNRDHDLRKRGIWWLYD